jgi:hypothetical protein
MIFFLVVRFYTEITVLKKYLPFVVAVIIVVVVVLVVVVVITGALTVKH